MKALFVGLGSIGQRHLTNFKAVAEKDSQVLACRSTKHNTLIADGVANACNSLKQHYGLEQFDNLDDSLRQSPDVVFVTNPSSKHLEVALKAIEYGCDLFIEKPLSHNLDKVDLLRKQAANKPSIVMVGYQTRFHPCYKLVKTFLADGKYGSVVSAGFEWGTYLPSHHPYEDYRKGYAAIKDLGGGVILGMIHEIDMICSFWKQPESLVAVGGKLSTLEIDVEDTVSVLMNYKQGRQNFPVSLFLSYAQTKESRKFRIQLEKATVFCDLLENTVSLFDETGMAIIDESYTGLQRNTVFLDEMKEFVASVRERRQPSAPLEDGIESLKLAMRIKDEIIG
ncbi:Gfo/Idh/MocA family oxidoreductase [Candidatus Pacearchaeota archaeon]|nr:Gfo/Idh/MocA family oxidoreductase [Candidatus Pacearchaeota archaeon]